MLSTAITNVYGAALSPHNIGLGAAHDPDLIRRIGDVTAAEMRSTGMDWSFAPTIAVARDESPLPAIKRVPTDAEVPTGPLHVPPIKGIEQHPLKPGLCAPAQPLPISVFSS